MKKVAADDPNRCQRIAQGGDQCTMGAMPDTPYCKVHGGVKMTNDIERAKAFRYQFGMHRERIKEYSSEDTIKNLRDEIAVLRMLISKKLESCKDDAELMLNASSISELVLKVERLVKTCISTEDKLGETLDKTKLEQFANSVIQVICDEITDPEIIGKIGERIAGLL
jgi:ribosome-binding factor A